MDTPPHRTRNPWGQGERLRVEILQAAARLLSELGGEQGLSIRGVARTAGIAPASIYRHFADKAALVQALIDYDYEQLTAAMRAADDACPPDDPLARVRAQLHAYSQFAIDSPGHYRLLINNQLQRGQEALQTGPVDQVVAAFERCEQAGIKLRIPPPRAAIVVFVGTHGWVALWHVSGNPYLANDVPALVDELIDLVIDCL